LISRDFLLGTSQIFKRDLDDNKNPVLKEENIDSPGDYFLNLNKVSFKNTISIKQLGNKTDKELSTELKNKIINLSSSKDETISIERILSTLNSIKEEAGMEDNPKTLLGQYTLRLNDLSKYRENIININKQVMFLAMEKKKLSSKTEELDMRIAKLNQEIKEHELSLEKNKLLKAEPIKNELEELNKKLKDYKDDLLQNYSKNDFEEAVKLSSSLNAMHNEHRVLLKEKEETEKTLKYLTEDVVNNVQDDFSIEMVNFNYNTYKNNVNKETDLQNKIKKTQEEINSFKLDELNLFVEKYDEVDENNSKINVIKAVVNEKSYDLMKKYIKSNNLKSFMLFFLGSLFLGGAIFSGYAGYNFGVIEYYAGTSIAILSLISYISFSKTRKRVKNAKNEVDSIDCENAVYMKSLDELSQKNNDILKEINCSDQNELQSLYEKKSTEKAICLEKIQLQELDKESLNKLQDEISFIKKNLIKKLSIFLMEEITEENINEVNVIYQRKDSVKENILDNNQKLQQLVQSINKLDKEIAFEETRFNMILKSNNMDTFEKFKSKVEYYESFADLKNKKMYCENMLNTILDNITFEELKNKTQHTLFYEIKEVNKKEHQLNIFKLNEEKNNLLRNINNIEKEIDELENSVRGLAEVEEEIEFYEEKKAFFKEKIKVADIAAEKIISISDSIKGDFMPLLRKSISENFSYLTGGNYKEVNIDENMNISVVREDNKKNIDIESLSGGTLDQLYLSLRISLSNILSGNQNIPIILDDSFVQYDSGRLKNSLLMLFKESERRQVILFTCQEREVELAKQLNVKFNYLKL
ncbi:MAG: hypothetical protein K0Q97_2913, partial [Bacillota bacterium]|nr:hypothetical protein [Bacillota bacterium]